MKTIIHSAICLLGAGSTALFGQQFSVIHRAQQWNERASQGSCEVRAWVDNAAEIGFQGERVFVRTLQGQPARIVAASCTAPMPRSGVANLIVRATEGRGQAQLIEQPNSRNGYVAVIRVEDPQSGGAEYGFRMEWRAQGATYFTDQDYNREWDHSRWDNARHDNSRQDFPPGNRRIEDGQPNPQRAYDRGWRTDRNYRRPIQTQADGWGRIHADQREGQRISRFAVVTEADNDAIITMDTDRGQIRFLGRIQSQDDRSLGVSLHDAMGRAADGYVSIHFDASGSLQSATMDGNWGQQHFVASFNRRYAR